MLILLALLVQEPQAQVPERVDAVLPPISVATNGLLQEAARLRIDPDALFDADPAAVGLAGGESNRDRLTAELSSAIDEEAADLEPVAAESEAERPPV